MATTMREVAEAAGVSIATVSFVVNNSKRVAPETRERIERVMAELGFRRNVVARALASRRTQIIALVYPMLAHRLAGSVTEFITSAARAASAAELPPGGLAGRQRRQRAGRAGRPEAGRRRAADGGPARRRPGGGAAGARHPVRPDRPHPRRDRAALRRHRLRRVGADGHGPPGRARPPTGSYWSTAARRARASPATARTSARRSPTASCAHSAGSSPWSCAAGRPCAQGATPRWSWWRPRRTPPP